MTPITEFSQLDLTKSYTYADYLTWKFDEFVELIKGEVLRPMAGPRWMHQVYAGNIFGEIRQSLKKPLPGVPRALRRAPNHGRG